jgi:hypothetical protein
MMAIFFIKYAVGVILARKLPIANEQIFIAVVSFCYGLISGIFLARTFVIYRSQVFDNTTLSNRRFLRKADTTRLR